LGITGTGGAGKSSVTDELVNRFLQHFPQMRIGVLAVDPTRRRTGGALLGDRIRMNSLRSPRVFMRSMATRRQHVATSAVLKDCIAFMKGMGYDLVIVETAGIGQSDSEIVDLVDFPVYVMTSDYGAASQLEKIDMIDFAELVVLNKFDKRGAEDALRDVRKQWKRNRVAFQMADEDVPVYPTIASQFNDPGVTWMFVNLCRLVAAKMGIGKDESGSAQARCDFDPQVDTSLKEPRATVLIPGQRTRYLAEIAEQGRAIGRRIESEAEIADRAQSYYQVLRDLADPLLPKALDLYPTDALLPSPPGRGTEGEGAALAPDATQAPDPHPNTSPGGRGALQTLRQRYNDAVQSLSSESLNGLRQWPARLKSITDEATEYQVRDKTIRVENYRESLSHQKIPKIAAPSFTGWGELLTFLGKENLPGGYPYTGGVYPYRRSGE
ncbi:MAG: methylmalonyl-CoA mutase, partial [Gammaproteobacteria bacterium HGW-Gammaproteobacteria-7]